MQSTGKVLERNNPSYNSPSFFLSYLHQMFKHVILIHFRFSGLILIALNIFLKI